MTEVRPLESRSAAFQGNQVGLFATKDYQVGDVISMDSCPLIQLSPKCLGSPFHKEWITEMMTTTSHDSAALGDVSSKMMAMVEVAFCFVLKQSNEPLENWETHLDIVELRQLYRPQTTQIEQPTTLDGETSLIELAQRAERYVTEKLVTFVSTTNEKKDDLFRNDRIQLRKFIKNTLLLLSTTATTEHAMSHGSLDDVSSTKLHPIVQEVMLIWACNAFDGGIIYKMFSRINHSCDPNSVIVVIDQENQSANQILKAALPISRGDEICISYLHGPFLYADRSTRQQLLLQDKYFVCACSRCETTSDDSPSAIPCLQCYPREYSQAASTFSTNDNDDDDNNTNNAAIGQSRKVLLDEDVQYDDDHNVHYQYPDFKIVPSLSNIHGPEWACPRTDVHRPGTEPKLAQVRYYHQVYSTARAIVEKVVTFLRHARPNQHCVPPDQTSSHTDGNTQQEFEEEQAIYFEQLEQLLRMSSCILGAKHWTTNMLLLYQLNHTLSIFHTRSILKLTSSHGHADNDDEDDAESTIAEAIDMLQRIEVFVNGVTLVRLHMGHLLSDVIIGVARALVSLGDVKSQTYAAQWIGKIADYVQHFESSGSQAVVQALQTAWQRHDDDSTAGPSPDRAAKRLKR